jgi:hypothetical protein
MEYQFITIILIVQCFALSLLSLHLNLREIKKVIYAKFSYPIVYTCVIFVIGYFHTTIFHNQEGWHDEIRRWICILDHPEYFMH